ncbi:MAG: hypothetical protein QY303_04580 [Vicingaceae bacterium]|nr:MAG: hypothetical protein QY303_04580 [Vicingaceae bacterium]
MSSKAIKLFLNLSLSLSEGRCFKNALSAFFGDCVINFIKIIYQVLDWLKYNFKPLNLHLWVGKIGSLAFAEGLALWGGAKANVPMRAG